MLNITIQSCATKALQVCYKSKPLEDYFCAGFCAEILARVQESIGTSNAVRKTKSRVKLDHMSLQTAAETLEAELRDMRDASIHRMLSRSDFLSLCNGLAPNSGRSIPRPKIFNCVNDNGP